jgi:hypothetical protein
MPPKFEEYIKAIDGLDSPYKTDCAVRLLDLDYKTRELFVNAADKTKEKTRGDNGLYSFSTVMKTSSLGFSFISMNANSDLEELFRQVFTFAQLKKYVTKCKEWVGLGWDRNSKKIVDIAVFSSYDWQEDPVIAKLAKDNLKQGEMLSADKLINES